MTETRPSEKISGMNTEANTEQPTLSPTAIKTKEFGKSMRGYAPREVNEYMDEIVRSWELMQARERELRDKVSELELELARWKEREREVDEVGERARKDADAVREKASHEASRMMRDVEEKAEGIRRRTEEWLETVISTVEETERQKANFVTAFKSSLDSHYELLKEEGTEAEGLSSRLTAYLRSQQAESAELRETEA